mmetsp:Transcript_1658/g.2624  ORF Transcript_1658/g.2624 Transcript_1658/m.2624 type:complete len:153 (-) Transcript_1658:25-483(-)
MRRVVRGLGGSIVRRYSMQDILASPSRASMTIVNEFDEGGFVINGTVVRNSVLLLPKNFLIWNTTEFEEIDIKSLDLFTYLYPTVETLLVGCGKTCSKRIPIDVIQYFKLRGIVIEQMNSIDAAQTFNILIAEGRNIGAAILPLEPFPSNMQ